VKTYLGKITATLILALGITSISVALAKEDAVWRAVNANSFRKENDAARDTARNPEAFLRFLNVSEKMTVAEVNPGGGWYSRILATLLKGHGKYVGLEHHPDIYVDYINYSATLRAYPDKLEIDRAAYGSRAIGTWVPSPEGLPVEAGSLDRIIAVRALHNWVRMGFFDQALDQAWQMLKDGGVFGVVQHRAAEDAEGDRKTLAERGRWKQSDLIAAVEARGFKLVAASEMNANPKDSKDYVHGVWTLPPRYALGDEDKAKYSAIGESDRMTLKFVKVKR